MSIPNGFLNPRAVGLYRKLVDRTARTGVVGLGYVGLPLAAELGQAGFTVVGVDVDAGKCDAINRGESHVSYVPADTLSALVEAGRLRAVSVSELSDVEPLDTVSICVPTPLRKTKDPDLSYVLAAAQAVKALLKPAMLVVLESTTFPGTTEEVLRSVLEETGLKAGTDFFLAYSPERVDPGLPGSVLRPRVVGGLTPDCSALAGVLYGAIVDKVVPVSSPRAAEMTKLLENTFRAVNIGLINEVALMCESLGIDVWEVVAAAATKPAGFMPFYPGPGLGGHCIPIDPFYLSWKVKEFGLEARFIELAGQINGSMPRHVVEKITEALNSQKKAINGAEILVMGVSYKADVDDVREAPALEVIHQLLNWGAKVAYHDPFVPRIDARAWAGGVAMESVSCTPERLAAVDCVVVLTDHTAFTYDQLVSTARLVVDTCNAVKAPSPTVFKLGAPNPQP
jgi:UDP-N-acetyl-D-glucosamine dehydrogenase